MLLQTGPRAERARAAAQFAASQFHPRVLVMAGYAGGLAPGLASAALVVANPLCEPRSGREAFPPDELLKRARQAGEQLGEVHFGRLLTLDRVLGAPRDKARAHEESGALAVDMESLGALRAANVSDTPFIAIRAIVDDARTELPAGITSLLDARGNAPIGRAIVQLLRRPGMLAALPALKRRADLARERLAAYLEAFVARLDGFEAGDAPSRQIE